MSKVVAQLEEALALQTGTCPSSSKIYDDLDEYFNIFSLSETSETRDFFDESRPTSRLSSPTTESDENFNIFSTDTSFESSEKRDVLDQSRPTSRLRGPTTDSWMKSVQSRTDALTIPSLSLIPRAENVLPKTVIGFIQKKGKWRRGRD
ncbi:hypothetical protein L1987_48773 [Smallanthus sonchifolius]|uniref:Uncharacterized protein n=1 Tax=Smallanthus sonchifolius TaxID=185202 RepID=A0ACB9FTT0_9ASTR|nr:hypothetical protein L1987_48773 [Smallanthus sonchifolius]